MHPLSDDLITVKEAAKIVPPYRPTKSGHSSESRIRRWIDGGDLQKYESGGLIYVSLTQLKANFINPVLLRKKNGRWVRVG